MSRSAAISTQQCVEQIYQQLADSTLYYGHGTDNPWDEACWLMTAVRCPGQQHVELDPEQEVTEAELERIDSILHGRIRERLPLAYLLREAWFAGLPFYVDERVLVPRSPIAELITQHFESVLRQPPARILDLCCGSGCIGIACAVIFPGAKVVVSDLSADALEVAAVNVSRHGLGERVSLVQSDLFDALEGSFDLIVCNPPYVSAQEYEDLPEEYHREPQLGLVSANEGLELPLKILEQAGARLNPDGCLILESGNSWQALEQAMPQLPFLWLEFEHGGHGVCALPARHLPGHGQHL